MRMTISILVMLFSCAAFTHAQTPTVSFADLHTRLKIGDSIIVTEDGGRTTKGELRQVSDTMLVVGRRMDAVKVPGANVLRVAQPVRFLRRGALIGLAAGFTFGAVTAARSDCGIVCFSTPSGVLLMGGLFGSIGMGAGAAVGTLIHRERVVFSRAVTTRVEAGIAPALSPSGARLRVHLEF